MFNVCRFYLLANFLHEREAITVGEIVEGWKFYIPLAIIFFFIVADTFWSIDSGCKTLFYQNIIQTWKKKHYLLQFFQIVLIGKHKFKFCCDWGSNNFCKTGPILMKPNATMQSIFYLNKLKTKRITLTEGGCMVILYHIKYMRPWRWFWHTCVKCWLSWL